MFSKCILSSPAQFCKQWIHYTEGMLLECLCQSRDPLEFSFPPTQQNFTLLELSYQLLLLNVFLMVSWLHNNQLATFNSIHLVHSHIESIYLCCLFYLWSNSLLILKTYLQNRHLYQTYILSLELMEVLSLSLDSKYQHNSLICCRATKAFYSQHLS